MLLANLFARAAPRQVPRRHLPTARADFGSRLTELGADTGTHVQEDPEHQIRNLQKRFRRLKQIADKLEWPRPTSFEALGATHPLPFRWQPPPARAPDALQVTYLAGFFDGDGCVTSNGQSGTQMRVSQSVHNAGILLQFIEAFGGSILLQSKGQGFNQPVLLWCASGESARNAAKAMHPCSAVKTAELALALVWPSCPKERHQSVMELAALKQMPNGVSSQFVMSWAYLAGFFDAEGCIRLRAGAVSLAIEISQKHASILHVAATFLQDAVGCKVSWSLNVATGVHVISVTERYYVTEILRQMLEAGLFVKEASANVALALTASTHQELRQAMASSGKGSQALFSRLSPDGCQRAKNIVVVSQRVLRARKSSNNQENLGRLELQLAHLKQNHQLHNAQERLTRLRQEMRGSLEKGARLQR
ncbi:unnamed protein product [Effrenium voratum]|nr:unnamed protein product [Effrenium voratum]